MHAEKKQNHPRPCRLCGSGAFSPVCRLEEVEVLRCQACQLVQLGSRFALKDLKEHYTHPGEDRSHLRPEFDRRKIERASAFRARYFQKHTGLTSGTVLEVGSAQGHFLAILQERGFEVLGVEPGQAAAEAHREKGIPVVNDLLEHAELPDGHFDAICMFQVFEHFEEPKQVAQILNAKLKPRGFLVVEVPDIFSIGARFEKQPHNLFKKEHICYFSPDSLNSLFVARGFTQMWMHHCDYDGLRLPFAKSLNKIVKPIFNPRFKGLLERILEGPSVLQLSEPRAAIPGCQDSSGKKSAGLISKDFRKNLTAPLDICLGYLAFKLDRGASLVWIGRKAG